MGASVSSNSFENITDPVKRSGDMTKLLKVGRTGLVAPHDLEDYARQRRLEVSRRLDEILSNNAVARRWLANFSETDLYEDGGEQKYLGDPSGQAQAVAAVQRVKVAADLRNAVEVTSAIEEFINYFCGFHNTGAKLLLNALHFQYRVDTGKLCAKVLTPPSATGAPSAAERAVFDDNVVGSAELLLRTVVEKKSGLVVSPFSPGMPMGKLLQLPVFAQFVLVLINAVEAMWYQEALPDPFFSMNMYVSLLVEGAPVEQMVEGARSVEVMELSKGTRRGPHVAVWIQQLRRMGKQVLIDDFDANHPCLDTEPHGIKVCVFTNAFHSLQSFKEDGAVAELSVTQKEKVNSKDYKDFYGTIVPMHQPNAKILIMEGSENCLKSEKSPGPPLNYDTPAGTTASAYIYQAAAKSLLAREPGLEMWHQGGRSLYGNEDFDEDAKAVIEASEIPRAVARATAGTMAWCGQEALRRWAFQIRPRVQGIVVSDSPAS